MHSQAAHSAAPAAGSAAAEWKAHWPVVTVSALGVGLAVSHVFTMGIFMAPVSKEFGWTRAQYSSAMAIISLLSFFCAPLVGMMVDRLGPRRIGIFGAFAYCGALALLSTTGGSIWHWWANWLLVGLGLQFVKATVWTAAVASCFATGRGLAIAVALSGSGLASAIDPFIAYFLIEKFGWRGAYVSYAAFWALLTIPLCLMFFYGAQDRYRTKDRVGRAANRSSLRGLDLKKALLSVRFVKLAAATCLTNIFIQGLVVHYIPIVTGAGMSRANAVGLAGVIGINAIIGRLSAGFLFDRFHGTLVGAAIFVMPAIACGLLLFYDGSMMQAAIVACFIGWGLGGDMDAAAYLSSRYFGLRNYGAVLGLLVGLLTVTQGIGPLLAGWDYDREGSYLVFLCAGIPVALLAALLTTTLGPYPDFPPTSAVEGAPAGGA